MIVKPIRDTIMGDSGVTGQLSTYDFGSGAEAAVFTVDPMPEDATYPAVVVTQPSGVQWNTCDKVGAEVDIDVRVYADKGAGRSSKALRDVAWDIWELLNLCTIDVPGYTEWGVFCSGPPHQMTDEDGFPGYRIPLMVRVLQL